MDQPRLNPDRIAEALRVPAGESSDFDLDPGLRPAAPALRPASVLVPLVARGAEIDVLLTRRTTRLVHHPGQVAFPGGKQDHRDEGPLAAALREAREEIGLDPARVAVLGRLDGHATVTGFRVTPFVGLVRGAFEPRPDPDEVDEVFAVPLAFLVEPANLQVHARRWGGTTRHYYAIPYGPHYIWGATARIIRTLAERLGPP
jgi:8-oxo-dGTP pyrophosphatase MutT (NUDIX family)